MSTPCPGQTCTERAHAGGVRVCVSVWCVSMWTVCTCLRECVWGAPGAVCPAGLRKGSGLTVGVVAHDRCAGGGLTGSS